MVVYVQNPKESTTNFLELISDYCRAAGYKANIQKWIVFPYYQQEQLGVQINNTIYINKMKPLGTNNKYVQNLCEKNY